MNEIFNKGDHIDETSNVTNTRTCILTFCGCKNDQKLTSIKEHYLTEQHQKIVVVLAKQSIEKDKSHKTSDIDIKENIDLFCKHYKNLTTFIENIEGLNNKISLLTSDEFTLQNRQEMLTKHIKDLKAEISLQKDHIEAMSINQNILTHDFTSVQQQFESKAPITKHHKLDGTMIWKISNVREKMYDAKSERRTSIYSPAFYTSGAGYKLCIRLYLNGDGTSRKTHLSIFLVILRGKYDALLKWPFSYRVSFCLFDQRTITESGNMQQTKHVIESFRPDVNSISFERPRSEMNIASGIPKFFPLIDLNQPEGINRYIVNDTMFIQILIDFIGIPKTILPFIFNLNIALPLEIKQKLIDDEIKRHEEQHIS